MYTPSPDFSFTSGTYTPASDFNFDSEGPPPPPALPSGLIEIGFSATFIAGLKPPIVARQIVGTGYFLVLYDTVYYGEVDLPMSSLSVSSRSGNPSTINAVVPFTTEYAEAITNAMENMGHCVMMVYRTQTDNTGQADSKMVEYGDITTLQTDIGPKNASIILTATSTKTNAAPKAIAMRGLSYVSTVNGKKRVRCTPSNDLTVGDTITVGGYTLVANNIQLNVTPTMESMEVYE